MVRRKLIALAAAAIAALLSCTSPDDLMDAATKDVKESLDMYLVVEGASPADNSSSVNPNAVLYVDFDRALDTSTVTATNIAIAPSSAPNAATSWTWSYDKALKRLYLTPAMLEGGVSYLVTMGTGLRSADGEALGEEYSWNFTTAALPGGTIFINGGATYATADSGAVTLGINANALVDKYYYSETSFTTASSWYSYTGPSVGITLTGDGTHTIYYQFQSAAAAVSSIRSTSIILDTTHPSAPVVTSPASGATHTPTWAWASGGGGNGVFMYYISGAWSAETTATSYTPSPGIADGTYSFYARERDEAGNWSSSSTLSSVTINAPPNAPTVTRVASVTLDTTPTWSWATGGFGNGTFQYQLDATSGTWISTTSASYTPGSALSDGLHYLYVEERDAGAEWSSYGYASIRTTPVIPYNKAKASTLPALSWRGIRYATYEVQISRSSTWETPTTLVSGLTTNSYQVTKSSPLPVGTVYWRVVVTYLKAISYVPSESGSIMYVVK